MSTIFSRKKRPKPRPPESPPSSSHSRQQKKDALSRMKVLMADVIPVVQKAADLASEATSDVAVPGLSMGLSALAAILEQIQTMKKAVEGVDTLHDRVGELSRIVTDFYERPRTRPVPHNMKKRLEDLSIKWEHIAEQAKQIGNRGALRRFFTADSDAEKVEGFVKDICDSIQLDAMRGLLNIEEIVEDIQEGVQQVQGGVQNIAAGMAAVQKDINKGVGAVQENVDKVVEGVTKVDEGVAKVSEGVADIREGVTGVKEGVQAVATDVHVLKVHLDASFMPTYAKRAHYKASNVRKACLEGTRVDLLEELWKWILTACAQTGADITYLVYWINGLAGTGKTTIAVSIAERCEAKGLLAASFCCARDDTECNKPDLVFVTISRQLCYYFPPLKEKVAEVLSQNPAVVHSDPSTQFEKLILEPLEKLDCDFPRSVVVIDALDECCDADESATSTVVGVIAKFDARIAPFLAFVATSRPDRHVVFLFSEPSPLKDATTRLLLHEVKLDLVSHDIHQYMQNRFTDVVKFHRLPPNWPSSGDMLRLVQLSAGLFIWAATALRFIEDTSVRDPEYQLEMLLHVQTTSQGAATTPEEILNSLYSQVAEAAFSRMSKRLADRLEAILGTIVLAQEPLSVATVAALTESRVDDIRRTLEALHAVLHISEADDEPIRIIHPTFAEYLLRSPSSNLLPSSTSAAVPQSSSSTLPSFSIVTAAQHARILSRVLKIMDNLEPNIVKLPTPSTFQREVTNLASTVKEQISEDMSYSCCYWTAHLDLCNDAELIRPMLDSLNRFFHERLLNWLEACSLSGAVDGSIAALQVALKACQNYGEPFALLAEFIFDCLRFTQTYYPCIDAAPLQVRHSLLALAPAASLVKKQYAGEVSGSLQIMRGAPLDWGLCIDTIVGHNRSPIFSVSFSADGAFFATGGGDGYIRIWRTVTRTSVKAIPAGDSAGCRQVAFSPSGMHVASAPDLHIWDTKTGDAIHTLEHEGASRVVYSADGTRLASGSDEEIKIWDLLNGTCLDTITSVRAASGIRISADGSLVGGNTAENYAVIYNLASKATGVLDQEEGTDVAAFSPDGNYAASRGLTTMKVWALKGKSLVCAIDASSTPVHVMFSHDSTQIGCACSDGCIRIWTIASDNPPRMFTGHTAVVTALAWSPNDTQVISVGSDGTIRVWDLTRHRGGTTLAASPPSSLPPLPGAPCYAVLRTPQTTALFPLPAPIQPSTAASDAAEDASIITLHADMADAWDAILRGGGASGEFVASRDWAFLTGRLHANMDERLPVAMTPDGLLLAYRPNYNNVKVHNHRTGDHVRLTLPSLRWPTALAFTSDNNRLAIADDCWTLCVRDITSQSDSPIWEFKLDHVSHAIAFSHDGSLLVIGTGNGGINVCDAATGKSVKHLHSTQGEVEPITFSADDKHVITQAHPWLIIWDVTTGDQILEVASDQLFHSFDFDLDDTGILVPDGKGETTKVTLWSPGERTWPVYAVTGDGWLYAKGPGKVRRLCWLPPEWRTVFSQGGPKLCALDFERKRTVVFDVSHIPEYVEAWGAEDVLT